MNPALLPETDDPAPVEIIHADARSPVLLVCEHAGRRIPTALTDLGLDASLLELHIAWDIGAEDLSRRLADRLACTLLLQRYSRLVIDCNRPAGSVTSIPECSDGVPVPANRRLSSSERRRREEEIFLPYTQACQKLIAQPGLKLAFSVHSFTPCMAGGVARPWDVGFLFRHPDSRGQELLSLCHNLWPELVIGDNQPYTVDDESDWFIPVCAEPSGLAHCLIEVRNDHLLTDAGRKLWADRLHHLITLFLETIP